MAASLAASSRRSTASSNASLRRPDDRALAISVDMLVNHLLVAKRSLSSMTLVLRANELVTTARQSHEDAVILAAQTGFLRASIDDQAAILERVRRSLQATYDWGKRDFKRLVRAMDEVDGELEGTMEMLRGTGVRSVLRPKGEERKTLLDFVDEGSVHAMREAMKTSIQELQGIQLSFDRDLLRLDTDIRSLNRILDSSPPPPPQLAMRELMLGLFDRSSNMADVLASLTKHFDMCVTAIRTTEGAAALARRKAAEVTQSQGGDSVSISGVIAEQESNVSDLEPKTAKDRAEMLKIVIQDAELVDSAVQEIQEQLGLVEHEYSMLEEHTEVARKGYLIMLEAYAALGEIGDRLADYLAAEEDFRTRWEMEKDVVFGKLTEMKQMRDFYEGYASAYDGLLLEVERRRTVEHKVQSIWRKAQESVDKMLEADRASREAFRQEVGEFLPTDLWAGTQSSAMRWKVVPVKEHDQEVDGPMDEAPR